jgi:pSer/pThr/pTyr-binding forkhead associated (FHA) protein
MARLVILSEGMTGTAHELTVDKTTIGRVDDNTWPIPESSVSSHHCEILQRGGEIIVRDLNSTNGTFIMGNQVTGEAPLKPGQILRLGQIEMRLEDNSSKPAPAKKLPQQTMVIPQGVKIGMEPSTTIHFEKPGFSKKSNKGTKIFIAVIVVVALVVAALLLMMLHKSGAI